MTKVAGATQPKVTALSPEANPLYDISLSEPRDPAGTADGEHVDVVHHARRYDLEVASLSA
jgi:hypothetical protein